MSIKEKYRAALINTLLFFCASGSLIIPALLNGYPLVYSDTGTYLYSGHSGIVPVDRPIMYGLFVRHISMSYSLWFVIATQAFIATSLILLCFRHFVKAGHSYLRTFIMVFFLSSVTGISNYTSQVMPDIFSGLVIISLALLCCAQNLSVLTIIYLFLLVILFNLSHSSNLLTSSCLVILIGITAVLISWQKKKNNKLVLTPDTLVRCNGTRRRINPARAFFPVALSWLLLPSVNLMYGGGFGFHSANNVFLAGRMSESGILESYLEKKCTNDTFPLCEYRGKFPAFAWQFFWDYSGPLYGGGCMQKGWGNCWVEKDKEYGPVIRDILSDPVYRKRFAVYSAKESFRQLITFDVGHLTPMTEGSPVIGGIKQYYPDEYARYLDAKQAHGTLYFVALSSRQHLVVLCSLIIITCACVLRRTRIKIPGHVSLLLMAVISGLLINAAVCATFSGTVNRYEGRVIWLLPLAAIIILHPLILAKYAQDSRQLREEE